GLALPRARAHPPRRRADRAGVRGDVRGRDRRRLSRARQRRGARGRGAGGGGGIRRRGARDRSAGVVRVGGLRLLHAADAGRLLRPRCRQRGGGDHARPPHAALHDRRGRAPPRAGVHGLPRVAPRGRGAALTRRFAVDRYPGAPYHRVPTPDRLRHPMPSASPQNVTALLEDVREGREEALDELLPLVYDELRALAHRQRLRQGAAETLNTTALVHGAYEKLVRAPGDWNDRAHFFRVAAKAMRQVIVDYARARQAAKRGGDRHAVPLDAVPLVAE